MEKNLHGTPQEQLLEHLRIYFVRLGFEVQKSREKAQEVLRLTQSESGDSARVYALSDKQQRAVDETLAEIKRRSNPEPRIRMKGCEHQLDRQIEWISEGACPICLTAECGIRGERIAALERELAEALQTRSASGDTEALRKEVEHWKRMCECAQNANSFRQQALEGNDGQA